MIGASSQMARFVKLNANVSMLSSHTKALAALAPNAQRRTMRTATLCQMSTADTPSTTGRSNSAPNWNIKMLYDGDCPLCMREVEMLQRRDQGKNKICFVDVAAPDYDASEHANVSFEQAMERIHAVLPDNSIVKDVEVFRRLYEEVGLGWVYAITKVPVVEKAANAVYDVWAKYRLPITGRPDLETVLREKKTCKAVAAENQ